MAVKELNFNVYKMMGSFVKQVVFSLLSPQWLRNLILFCKRYCLAYFFLCCTSPVRGPTVDQFIGFIQHSLILIRMEKDYMMLNSLYRVWKV